MRRTLMWVALGIMGVALVDWEESPKWREWRDRRCAEVSKRLDQRANSSARLDMNDTTKSYEDRLRERQRDVERLRELEQAIRCLQV